MSRNDSFLNLMDTIEADKASVGRLFDGEGSPARVMRGRARRDPDYNHKLLEAVRLIADVNSGHRPTYLLREALGTADFPNLFGDILDRQLLSNYRETPQTYRNYCSISTVPDFRVVKRFAVNGGEGRLPQVPEQTEYPEISMSDQVYSYKVNKYGERMPFAWEAYVNDDLDAIRDTPARFGRGARRTEEYFATSLFVDTNGPHASFYTTANKNRVHTENGASANNPPLSIQALQDAMIVLDSQVDTNGEPIIIESVRLVVPPALRVVANNILNSTEIWLNLAAAVGTQQLHTQNWVKGMVDLDINYYARQIATTNGATSWYLFANPSTSRPAIQIGFLRGHETPELFMKESNATRIGGGTSDAMDGDFDTDAVHYKVRHVIGGSRLDPKATVASNGSGS